MAVLNDEAGGTLLDEAGRPLLLEIPFPQVPLNADVELQLAGTWTRITSFAMQRAGTSPPISITRGRPDETSKSTASQCTMQWNNRDGRFSPRNPTGPYYGQLTRNTPLRVSVPGPGVYLRIEDDAGSYVFTPDSASLQITGTIDVRIDLELSGYQPSMLAYKWGGATTAWQFYLNGDGTVSFTWFDGSASHTATSTQPLPNLGRIMIRANLIQGSQIVEFFTAPAMAGSQTLLGAAVFVGSTSISAAAGQPVVIGHHSIDAGPQSLQGKVYEFAIYNSAGTLVADPVFTSASAGAGSMTDAQGNVWTLGGTAAFSNRSFRFHGECSSLPQNWDTSGRDVWTPVTAAGVLRRQQQGTAPVRSVMRRGIPAWPSVPSASMTSLSSLPSTLAYWPAEDTAGSTQVASGLAQNTDGITIPAMTVAGTAAFQAQAGSPAADSVFACSAALAQVQSSTWTGRVPAYSSNGTATMATFPLAIPSGGLSGTVNLVQLNWSGGSAALLELQYQTASGGTLLASGLTGQFGTVTGVNGGAFMIQMINISTSPAKFFLNILPLGRGQSVSSGSIAGGATGQLTSVVVNPAGANCGATELGHIWVQAAFSSAGSQQALPSLSDPRIANLLNAYQGEAAGTRFARLCAENGLASRVYGFPAVTAPMGSQAIDTLMNLLQACEDTDRGILYEPRQCLGLAYRTYASLTNQAAAVALDYSQAHLGGDQGQGLVPVDDDQFTINDVTLTRSGGSSVQVQVTTGPLSVNPPPSGAGDYSTSLTVYCAYDSQLPAIASWMTRVGTADAERYPVIPLNLARTALSGLTAAILAADIGGYVTIANPPAWLPPGPIGVLIWGTTEKLAGFWESVSWNAIPEIPYEVAAAGTARADTAASQLASGVTSAATSLSVSVTAGDLWTTSGFPFDIQCAGERMTVTAITGGSSPQTFTVTRSVNGVVKAQAAGAAIRLWATPVAALAGAA